MWLRFNLPLPGEKRKAVYESETRGGGRGYALQPVCPSLFLSR
ncbi:hypothetical protein NC651_015480 [Populus alba x Populus x berolinensis]|nr:hypothetical protein NC651_015480 [Populus alba x Populus x berolinensis]